MRWIKAIAFVVLSGALVAFNILFLDRLAERALEQTLETIFHARADVDELDISPMKARITFASITVADEQAPMKNLFQLGPTDIDVDLEQLLARKVVIENAVTRDIQWGTDRIVSGELPNSRTPEDQGGADRQSRSELLQSAGLDPEQILENEKANLKSLPAARKLREDLAQAKDKWESSVTELRAGVRAAEQEMGRARQIDVETIDTVTGAQSALKTIGEVTTQLQNTQRSVSEVGQEMRTELTSLQARSSELRTLIDVDYAYLKSRLAMPEGGLRGVLSAMAEDLIAAKLGRFSNLALRALDYSGGVREEKQAEHEAPGRRGGHNVPFAATTYPRFLLKNIAFSATHDDQSVAGGLSDLSSDPDMWDRPTTFRADIVGGDHRLAVEGAYDGRREAKDSYALRVTGEGLALDLESVPRLAGTTGIYRFETDLEISSQENTRGEAVVTVTEIRVAPAPNADMVTEIVRDALATAQEIVVDINYEMRDGKLDLEIKSNIDDEISREIGRRMGELLAGYQARMEAALKKELDPILGETAGYLGDLTAYQDDTDSAKGQLASYEEEMKTKAGAVTNKTTGDVKGKLEDTAGKIKLPSFGR